MAAKTPAISPIAGYSQPEDASATPRSGATTRQWIDAQLASGHLALALRAVNEALVRFPADPEIWSARARILGRWGRALEALEAYMRAEAWGHRNTVLYAKLAWSCFAVYGPQDAEPWMRKALESDPRSSEAQAGLAFMLYAQRRYTEAINGYRQALDLAPGSFDVLTQYGHCLLDGGDPRGAEEVMRQALELARDRPGAWSNLGITLIVQHREMEAGEAFEQAMRIGQQSGNAEDAFINLGTYYRDCGRIDEAIDVFERYLPSMPDLYGHLTYALLLLLAGRFAEGWEQNEFRWLNEPLRSISQRLAIPSWGGQSLDGKTLLLRFEQGVGDMVQFIRYAPLAKAMGARTVLSVPHEYAEFARSFQGIDQVLQRGERLPPIEFQISLLSLPRAFGTELTSIPSQIQYVKVDPQRAEKWSTRVPRDGLVNIGLVWAGNPQHGNDHYRSASLRQLRVLWEVAGVRFVSLQKGSGEKEIAELQRSQPLLPLGSEIGDWLDTAAVIDGLDLVISVDTAVAHLAGALGKPVWLMLPNPPDWRWLLERCDSPWYPTMRLFRQATRGNWDPVIERIKESLIQFAQSVRTHAAAQTLDATSIKPADRSAPVNATRNGLTAVTETRYGVVQYLPSEPLIGESLTWYGEWRQTHLDLLSGFVRPGMIVVEAAAGVGTLSLFLATRIGDSGHLMLYDNRPSLRSVLRNNFAVHRLQNATIMRRSLNARDSEGDTVDDLDLNRLDMLIVNASDEVELALAGAELSAWRLRPVLFLSAHDQTTAAAVASRVRDLGYRSWRCDAPLFNRNNFNRRENDIFAGRSAIAVLGIPEEFNADIPMDDCVEIV